ncbi:aminotransferase class V-fold PLP-dependent enzyme [Amycolatopsis sp. OK19-0408]|uniref:Kynureninase n=1 Tax=Amycolatopsis iheyensis TaxID=2945988 RepID=A0A9X2N9P1_9PSEU|nr:aminotransferase class V-fold PLP-dependent enzyme [Amycolatopsis iheyensis]MCR6483156.1 aminotransferase class V-fold PLP-dependent enzyme [Amycolatopsis iheyensis]
MTTLEEAARLDAEDELAAFADRFVPITDPGVVAYLDGNSLGRPLLSTGQRLQELVTHEWGARLIRSWDEGWLELPGRIGDELGRVALGAAPGQTIVADSTSVCLYKTLRAAVALRPGRDELVIDTGNFPTDRFLAESVAAEAGHTVRWIDADDVRAEDVAAVTGPRTAAVVLSHVDYRSAAIADLAGITRLVHDRGALTVWDLCHSAGSIPVELDAAGADFAVGCTYKFLNAGPGAPAFLYVNARHHEEFAQPITGWMGAADTFGMAARYVPAPGIRRALSGTPPVLGMVGVQEGVALLAEAGIERVRAKAVALGRWVLDLADAWLVPLGFTVASPREDARRGGHVTVRHPDAERLSRVLIEHGVLIDFRRPDGIRIGLSPLTTGFTEVRAAMARIRELAA